ncbi:hypothetical protein LINPERPRIM_LOCUS407, partial [Linum perenne]
QNQWERISLRISDGVAEDPLLSNLSQHFDPFEVGMFWYGAGAGSAAAALAAAEVAFMRGLHSPGPVVTPQAAVVQPQLPI